MIIRPRPLFPIGHLGLTALALAGLTGLFSLALVGCSPSVTLIVRPDAADSASFSSTMSSTAEKLVRKMSKSADTGASAASGELYDAAKMKASLTKAGFTAKRLEFPNQTGLSMDLTYAGPESLPASCFVIDRKKRTATCTLTREAVNALSGAINEDARAYLDMLMAPVFTGEELSEAEYAGIIGAAYGKTLAGELKQSFFTLKIRCPEPITRAEITAPGSAKSTGNVATFLIPLSSLLVLSTPISASAAW
jgi:hypothetical protein